VRNNRKRRDRDSNSNFTTNFRFCNQAFAIISQFILGAIVARNLIACFLEETLLRIFGLVLVNALLHVVATWVWKSLNKFKP